MENSADKEKAKLFKTIRVVIVIAVVLFFLLLAMMCAVPIINNSRIDYNWIE